MARRKNEAVAATRLHGTALPHFTVLGTVEEVERQVAAAGDQDFLEFTQVEPVFSRRSIIPEREAWRVVGPCRLRKTMISGFVSQARLPLVTEPA